MIAATTSLLIWIVLGTAFVAMLIAIARGFLTTKKPDFVHEGVVGTPYPAEVPWEMYGLSGGPRSAR